MLARSASEFVERHVRDAPHVDSNGWQGAAASDAGGEPLVECPVVRNGSRSDDISDRIRRKSIRTLGLIHTTSAFAGAEGPTPEDTPPRAPLRGPVLPGHLGNSV